MDVTGTTGDDSLVGSSGSDSIQGLAGHDLLKGDAGADTLRGGAGEDELLGGAGADLIDGGADYDFASYDGELAAVNVNLATGVAVTSTGNDTLVAIEAVIGTDFNDTLTGDGVDNVFIAHEGNNLISGGAGFDSVYYSWATGPVTLSLATGTASGYWGSDTLIAIEDAGGSATHANFIEGNGLANILNGGAAGDSINGAGGDDTLDGQLGNDTLDGGLGYDTAYFAGAMTDHVIALGSAAGSMTLTGAEGTDVLAGFESLAFGLAIYAPFDAGETAQNTEGTVGGDFIRARGGNDTVHGGGGDDILFGEAGSDSLDGGSGNDYLDGGEGADVLNGGVGNDVFVVDVSTDIIVEADGSGTDKVIASYSYTLGNHLEHLQLAPGSANLAATGNAFANVLTGNAGRNELNGQAGNDTLDGGEGIDHALYAGTRAQYTAAYVTGGLQINATATGEGTDLLSHLERLRFSDVNVALDIDGNAGIVAKTLGSVFGAAAIGNENYAGIGLSLVDGGMSFEALMGLALGVTLGSNATNEAVVELLYANVIGPGLDTATRDAYVDLIEQGYFTQASLGVLAANVMGVPAAATGGLEYV